MKRVNLNLHSLETISDVDYYKTFVLNKEAQDDQVKKNSTALFNLIGSINYLILSNTNSNDQQDIYINCQKENADSLQNVFNEYLKLRAFIISSRGGMTEFKTALYKEVDRAALEQEGLGRTADNIDWNIFIESAKRIIEICSYYSAVHRLEEAIELMEVTHRLLSLHKRMVDTNIIFSKNFFEIAQSFEDGFKDLVEAKEVLSNCKFKRTFEINQ